MADTRQRLIDGTIETIRRHGLAGTSARSVAAAAGVNQALVFYHFGSVHDLLKAACLAATQDRLAEFEARLAGVDSLRGLLAVGRDLHAEGQAGGNVRVLTQMMAGAQGDPQLVDATVAALRLWVAPVRGTLERLLVSSPVADLLDVGGLAEALCAAFVGLDLFEGVEPAAAAAALTTLDRLAILVEVIDELGPAARKALRAKLRKQ